MAASARMISTAIVYKLLGMQVRRFLVLDEKEVTAVGFEPTPLRTGA